MTDEEKEKSCVEFLEVVLNEKLPGHTLHDNLRSGVRLCKVVNIIFRNVKSKPKLRIRGIWSIPNQRSNIDTYLKFCQKIGMNTTFTVDDLYEGRNMDLVRQQLTELIELINKRLSTSEFNAITNRYRSSKRKVLHTLALIDENKENNCELSDEGESNDEKLISSHRILNRHNSATSKSSSEFSFQTVSSSSSYCLVNQAPKRTFASTPSEESMWKDDIVLVDGVDCEVTSQITKV